MSPQVSIITVTYNSQDQIIKSIKSVIKYTKLPIEIIVIDNDSGDQTTAKIKAANLSVKLIESRQNLGFSGGNNLGIKQAQGDYLFFLNPDTVFLNDVIGQLVSYHQLHPQIGLLAPKLVDIDGKSQDSVRNLPTPWHAIQEYWFNQPRSYEAYSVKGDQPLKVDSVVGAAMLIERSLFMALGGWGNKYFMYFEDLDLCRRLKRQHRDIEVIPAAVVQHEVGVSSRTNSQINQLFMASALKYHGELEWWTIYWIRRLRHIWDRIFSR